MFQLTIDSLRSGMLLIEVEGSTGVAPQELRKGEFPSEASLSSIGGKQARAKRVYVSWKAGPSEASQHQPTVGNS